MWKEVEKGCKGEEGKERRWEHNWTECIEGGMDADGEGSEMEGNEE